MSIYEGATGYGMVIFSNRPYWQGYVINPATTAQAEILIKNVREAIVDNTKGRDIPMELSLTSTTLEICPYVNEEDRAVFGNLMGGFASASIEENHQAAGIMAAALGILTCRTYFTVRAREVSQGVRTSFQAADEVALRMANILTGKSVVETFVAMCQRDPEVLGHQKTIRENLNLPSH